MGIRRIAVIAVAALTLCFAANESIASARFLSLSFFPFSGH
jgi:hypothetical protein